MFKDIYKGKDIIQIIIDVALDPDESIYTTEYEISELLLKNGYDVAGYSTGDYVTDYYTESKVVKESVYVYRICDANTGEDYEYDYYEDKDEAIDVAEQAFQDTGKHYRVEQYTYNDEDEIGSYEPEDISSVYITKGKAYKNESKVVKEGYGPTSDIKEFIKLYMQNDSLYSIEDYIDDFYDEGEITKSQRDSLYTWAEKWVEIR